MGFIIMVATIEMVSTIMDIDTLDMDTIILMGIATIMVDSIEHVMVYMGTIEIEDIMNVLMPIEKNVEVQIEAECMIERESMYVIAQVM